MNQQEFDRQKQECDKQQDGGGNTLAYMRVDEGVGQPIRTMWCGEEEQKSYKIGQCHENVFHLNKKIKGQVWKGFRVMPNGNSDHAPHYWLFKSNMIWDINTFQVKNPEGQRVRIWGYSLYKPQDFFDRYGIKNFRRDR